MLRIFVYVFLFFSGEGVGLEFWWFANAVYMLRYLYLFFGTHRKLLFDVCQIAGTSYGV
jgi:hypothetical protein